MAFYRICPDCGAYLDPGEQCSCHEEHLIEMERKEKATAFVEKMVKEERNGQLRLAVQEGKMLTPKDLEKYHQAAERILNAMDNSPVPISWHEMDRMALQSVIAKELILIDKEARRYHSLFSSAVF